MAYSKTLSKALSEAVERHRDTGLDLTEELTLTRVAAEDAVTFYDAACLSIEEGVLTGAQADLARQSAGTMMKMALSEVASMAHKAAAVAESRSNMLSGVALSNVLAQVIEAAHRVLGDEGADKAKALAAEIRKIRAPNSAAIGTTLTPDADVLAMDDTIPKGE